MGRGRLRVELHTPVAGQVLLTLNLAPKLTGGNNLVRLNLPRPLGATPADGALAYRVDGLNATDRAIKLGVSPVGLDAFAKRCLAAGLRDVPAATRVYSFSRNQQGLAALDLALQPSWPQVRQDIHWHIRPQSADVRATLHLTSAAEDILFVDWEVPAAVTVTEVSGLHVRYWTRFGDRVQVWLQQPRKDTTVTLAGWLTDLKTAPPVRSANLNLPCLRVPAAAATVTQLRLTATPGLEVTPERLEKLTAVAIPAAPPTRVYTTQEPVYRAAFFARAVPLAPEAYLLTSAEVAEGVLSFAGDLDLQAPQGEAYTVKVRLRGWAGEAVHLDAPGVVQRKEQRVGQERVWTLTLPPGVARHHRLKLSGRVALAGNGPFTPPVVTVEGAVLKGRWLAVVGPVQVGAENGVSRIKPADVAHDLRLWPAEAERVRREGMAWRVQRDGWQLRLTAGGVPGAPAVQVLLAEQTAAVLDGRHWAHQAAFTLYARGGSDVHLLLPTGARLQLLTVDGVPQTPRQPEPERLWLPLAGGDGVRVLRLRWVYDEGGDETLERPLLRTPTFKDLPAVPVLWTVVTPAGYRARPAAKETDAARKAGGVAQELARAEAQLRLSALLAERGQAEGGDAVRAALLAAQRRFAWHCRVAAYELALHPDAAAGAGPKGQSLADWLEALRQENARFNRLHLDAERQAPADAPTPAPLTLPDRGTPQVYQVAPGQAPRLRLTPVAEEGLRQALGSSLLLAAVLATIGLLAYLGRVAAVLRQLLPEQLILLAVLGWLVFGGSLVAAVLLLLGVGARLVLLVRALQGLWQRKVPPAPAGSSIGSAG